MLAIFHYHSSELGDLKQCIATMEFLAELPETEDLGKLNAEFFSFCQFTLTDPSRRSSELGVYSSDTVQSEWLCGKANAFQNLVLFLSCACVLSLVCRWPASSTEPRTRRKLIRTFVIQLPPCKITTDISGLEYQCQCGSPCMQKAGGMRR